MFEKLKSFLVSLPIPSKKRNAEIDALKHELSKQKKEIELLHIILDETPCHIYWKSLDNKYLGCNSSQAKELGLKSKENIINKSVFDLIDNKAQSEIIDANDKKVMKTGMLSTFDEPGNIKKKKKYYLSIKKPLYNNNKSIIGMIGISIDNTKQKVLEKKLSKTLSQAQIDEAAKSVFITNMSHDIRTPITGMLGLIDSLKPHLNTKKSIEINTTLENLTKKFLNFFNDILHTIETPGEIKSDPTFIDVSKMIYDVCDLFTHSYKQKGLELIVNVHKNVPKYIKSNDLLLKSIIANLVGNAIKFTNSGSIKINANYEPTKKTFVLEVQDTGIGIPTDKLSKIFNRFTRLQQSNISQNTSSGLGLFMVKKHIKTMMGHISVKSEFGKGSTFTIKLPIINTSEQLINKESALSKKIKISKTPKTLIIEDTKLAAVALKGLLNKFNYDSTIVETGKGALETLQKSTFDIIFLDLGLPDIDGMILLPKIKKLASTKNTVIIILSGHINPKIKSTCHKLGADAVITKPFSIDHLNALFEV